MKPVKVVHLSSVHGAFDIRIFQKECRSLAQAGYDVSLVAPHERDEVVEGVRIKAVPRGYHRLRRMTSTVMRVWREARRLKADVYHFHDPELIPAGLLLRACGKKVIYDIHEDFPRAILSKSYLPAWQRQPLARLLEFLENFSARWFSALITVTPTIAKRFCRRCRTVLVCNFPRAEEMPAPGQRAWSERSCAVAYVGGIQESRGIREMVRAMGLLPPSIPAHLVLATGDFPEELYRAVSREPGWARIEDEGTIGPAKVAALLRRVRAGLVLFHPVPNNVAAMPHKFFEYMAAGIPLIASDFPLWRDIISRHQCGLLVDPLNPQAIANAIEQILTHPEEAEAMGRRGQQAVQEHYNWETEERRLLELYSNLAEQPSAA